MLKTRVMPTLLYKDVGLVKGIRFDSWRRVGSVMQAVKVYNLREVDELLPDRSIGVKLFLSNCESPCKRRKRHASG